MSEQSFPRQLLMFAGIGILATLTHYTIALIALNYLNAPLQLANLSGYCSAVALSYFGHGRLTFRRPLTTGNLLRFLAGSLTTFALSSIMLALIDQFTRLPAWISLGLVVLVIPLLSFFINKYWVYRPHPEPAPGLLLALFGASSYPRVLTAGYCLTTALGLFFSYCMITRYASVDPDSSHSIVLWYGIMEHGLGWLGDWKFTQDNWLFSLFPFHFLGYLLIGASPLIPVFGGWLIFICSALISGRIAWQLKAPRAALLIPMILLYSGYYAHTSGLLAYSTTHNITNLFGLLALSLILSSLQAAKPLLIIMAAVLLYTGAVSDPWMLAAYNLPLAMTAVILLLFKIRPGSSWALPIFAGIAVLTIVAVRSRLFGLLTLFPAIDYAPGSLTTIIGNFGFLLHELGAMVNIIPLSHADTVSTLFSFAIACGLALILIHSSIKHRFPASSQVLFMSVFGLISIGGTCLAFLLNDSSTFDLSARFLINAYYLFIIFAAVLAEYYWSSFGPAKKALVGLTAGMFMLAGGVSMYPAWKQPSFTLNASKTRDLLTYLDANHLDYGYGPYWAANANAITALSQQRIKVRPVTFSTLTGQLNNTWRPQTSRRWYQVADIPSAQQDFFVIVASDPEECADVALCLSGLQAQFGPPIRHLTYSAKLTILVWDHPLTQAWQNPVDQH